LAGGGKIPPKKSPFLWFISLGEQRNEQKKKQLALKGKHRESGKAKGLFNANIPSVVDNKV